MLTIKLIFSFFIYIRAYINMGDRLEPFGVLIVEASHFIQYLLRVSCAVLKNTNVYPSKSITKLLP